MPTVPNPPTEGTPTPAIIYAAKSSPDERGSVADQQRIVTERVEREGARFLYGEPFGEERVSGYHRSRGPELEAAVRAAIEAAAEYGTSELWVFHTSRVARGSGKKTEARSYLKLWADLQAEGVQLRSVEDDQYATQPSLVGIASEQNHDYSVTLGGHVRRGLDKSFAAGNRLGGPVPDGYERLVRRDERDQVVERTYRLNPERADVVRLAFVLYEQGMGDPSVARELNRRSHCTEGGRPWTRRRVQDTLTNQFYAGRVVRHRGKANEEVRPGTHPVLIEPERFDRLLAMRGSRDKAAGSARRQTGRPPSNHALARLAVCHYCGGPLDGTVSTYRRKRDGSRKRQYRCRASHDGSGTCTATWSYDAEVIDQAVIANLHRYLGDFDRWREQIEDGHAAERERLAREVDAAANALHDLRRLRGAMEADYERHLVAGDGDAAATVLRLLTRRQPDEERAERRLRAAQDAAATVPTDAPADAMLDFYNGLSAALRGRLDATDALGKVNDALRDLFACFVLERTAEGTAIVPMLSPAATGLLASQLDTWPYAVTAKVGEFDAQVNTDGTLTVRLPAGAALPETAVIEYDGPPGVVATGREQIVPPLRRIDASSPERAQSHE